MWLLASLFFELTERMRASSRRKRAKQRKIEYQTMKMQRDEQTDKKNRDAYFERYRRSINHRREN